MFVQNVKLELMELPSPRQCCCGVVVVLLTCTSPEDVPEIWVFRSGLLHTSLL